MNNFGCCYTKAIHTHSSAPKTVNCLLLNQRNMLMKYDKTKTAKIRSVWSTKPLIYSLSLTWSSNKPITLSWHVTITYKNVSILSLANFYAPVMEIARAYSVTPVRLYVCPKNDVYSPT